MPASLNPLGDGRKVVLLAGGVGGARMAAGLAAVLPPEDLTVIANTGDDFTHFGLTICPDVDTVMYTLAGVHNPATGWGRDGETWQAMTAVAALGGPDWFRLGDRDLGTHLTRTHLLQAGETLTAVTARLARCLGAAVTLLPMSDHPAPTIIHSDEGALSFQTWFVRRRWQPAVRSVELPADVRATPAVVRALESADVVIIAPSNPFVSIDPILNAYPVRALVHDLPRAVVAVSPIIAGAAVKGPAAKLLRELGYQSDARAVADHYGALIDGFVVDHADAGLAREIATVTRSVDALMPTAAARERLARDVLAFAAELASGA